MNQEEAQTRMKELEQQIAELPVGSITRKTVNGKIYFYQRWSENGKRREKYIPLDEVDAFREQIEHRKTLEQEIKALRRGLPKVKKAELLNFITNVRTGNTLRTFADAVSCYQKRECFQQLHDYVYGETRDKVFILYGLRRTGKTTMIRQIFADMAEDELAKAAFIQIAAKDTLADVNKDLKTLEQKGFRYVFLDEVTLMEDYIEGAELLECDPRRLDDAAAWECVYVTLTWNHANALAGSHCDAQAQGLTAQGRDFVRALYAHRMLPDVSHLSEAAAWDVVRLGLGPVIASHANSRAVCAHMRNLSDDLFRAIRDSGGVVGLNLYTDFLGGGGMDAVVRHVEHLLDLGGDRTLALGGDLDGCDTLGGGITGVQDYPKLYAAIKARGYDAALLQDLFADNWLRVLPK